MANVISTMQSNHSSAAPLAAAASESTNKMQTILAAITNLSRPTPPVITKPKTEIQQILALLTARAGSENAGGGGGGNRNRNNRNNNNGNSNGRCKVSIILNL